MSKTQVLVETYKNNGENFAKTLTENGKTLMASMGVDETLTTEAKTLVEDYSKSTLALFNEAFSSEALKTPLETVPAQLNKVIELQKSAFEKSVEFWKKVAATYSLETQQKAAAKAIELTRANYEAMVSAATANVKATQEYFG